MNMIFADFGGLKAQYNLGSGNARSLNVKEKKILAEKLWRMPAIFMTKPS